MGELIIHDHASRKVIYRRANFVIRITDGEVTKCKFDGQIIVESYRDPIAIVTGAIRPPLWVSLRLLAVGAAAGAALVRLLG